MFISIVPWLLGLVTGAWFGRMAKSAGRNWIGWSLGGLFFGLVITTLVFGLGHATSIPFSDWDRIVARIEWTAVAIILIGFLGWICTSPLHRQYHLLWPRARRTAAPEPAAPGPATAKPKPSKSSPAVSPPASQP